MTRRLSAVLAALCLVAAALPATAAADAVRAIGETKVGGKRALVEVVVERAPGQTARAAGDQALRAQGARRIGSAELGSQGFGVTGLKWPTGAATQRYRSAGQPFPAARDAFLHSQATWSTVSTSFFALTAGSDTNVCPSLVKECPGAQVADGENGVGWGTLDRRTLGVTWFITSTPEADMMINTRFAWSSACTPAVDGRYDLESVIAHEDGHVAGLDHSDDSGSIMQATISESQAQCTLGTDDQEGVTYLYPDTTGTVTGTVTNGSTGIGGAKVSLSGTALSATTASDGSYTISGVPYAVTYDVVAAASGFNSGTVRQRIDTGTSTVNFALSAGGGGGSSFCERKPTHPRCT